MNENGQKFLEELQKLCAEYNVGIFAGAYGLKFHFMNEEDKENVNGYYTQNRKTKEFILAE